MIETRLSKKHIFSFYNFHSILGSQTISEKYAENWTTIAYFSTRIYMIDKVCFSRIYAKSKYEVRIDIDIIGHDQWFNRK